MMISSWKTPGLFFAGIPMDKSAKTSMKTSSRTWRDRNVAPKTDTSLHG